MEWGNINSSICRNRHPYASNNVTVYVVVELGETTIVDPLPKLLSHWYVPAPPAPEAIMWHCHPDKWFDFDLLLE